MGNAGDDAGVAASDSAGDMRDTSGRASRHSLVESSEEEEDPSLPKRRRLIRRCDMPAFTSA